MTHRRGAATRSRSDAQRCASRGWSEHVIWVISCAGEGCEGVLAGAVAFQAVLRYCRPVQETALKETERTSEPRLMPIGQLGPCASTTFRRFWFKVVTFSAIFRACIKRKRPEV